MMDMTTKRCGSCNCNELSPKGSRSSNRFSSRRRPLTITLTTLMIFSFVIVSNASPIQLTTPINPENVELVKTTTNKVNSTKSNSSIVSDSREIVPSLVDDLEQSIRESVKNEIQMDLVRDGSGVPIQGTGEFFSIEYPQKEIGDHVVITQTDRDSQTILVDGEPVREARNLHGDSNQSVNLLLEDTGHESPEVEQSVEKDQEIEGPHIVLSSSSASSESNAANESVDTSENLIDDAKPSQSDVKEESKTNELSTGFAVAEEKTEEVEKTAENEDPTTFEEEQATVEPKVDTELQEEEALEESKALENSAEPKKVINIDENTIDSEPTTVNAQEIPYAPMNTEDVVSTPNTPYIDAVEPEVENEETPETADEKINGEAVIQAKEISSDSDTTLSNEVHSNAEESVSHEPSVEVVHNSIELVESKPPVKTVVASAEILIDPKSQISQEQPLATTTNIVPEENDEEVLSVVLNENTAIVESPSNSVEKVSSDAEDEIVKPEDNDEEEKPVLPPQETEHTVIKKQGVDAEEMAVEGAVVTTTIKAEESHHLVIKKEGVEPVVANEAEQSELPEDDENVYEDDDEEVESPPQVVDVTEDVNEVDNSNNEVTDNEAKEAKVEEEKPIQDPIEPETEPEINTEEIEEVAETTTPEPTLDKNSSPVAYEDSAATLFESLLPRNAGQTFNDNVLTAESLGGIGKALPTRSINDNPSQRSSVIIVLCSGVALLFVVISVTIFVVSFQRQHGTLDIEMQEKRCGKDNRDDDPESCLKLLDIELPITMLPSATTTTATTTPTKSTDETASEASMPMTTLLTTNEIDECL